MTDVTPHKVTRLGRQRVLIRHASQHHGRKHRPNRDPMLVLRSAIHDPDMMVQLRKLCADWQPVNRLSDHDVIEHIAQSVKAEQLHLIENYEDLLYLARTLYGEARGETHAAREAVAWVIRNRVETRRWGGSYKSVVTAKLQFTCWSETVDAPNYNAIQYPIGVAWDDCMAVAIQVMSAAGTENPLPGATHYYSPKSQAALHKKYPDVYPLVPAFTAPPAIQVPNPPHIPADKFAFYKCVS